MSVIIYISGQQLQIIEAGGTGVRAKVTKAFVLQAPEGSVINGTVMDPEAFIPFMKEFFIKNKLSMKDVSLVVNSRKIAGKNLEVPAMSVAKTLDYVSREFADMDREENEGVFCYSTLKTAKNSKLKKIYAETVSHGYIQEYMGIFSEMGITLKGIYSSEGTLIKLIELSIGEQRKTFVVQIADDNLLTSVVWVNGSFYYYSSQRCFQDIGTAEYFEECVRTLNQIGQFMKANQIDSPIETIYIAGMAAEDAEYYMQRVRDSEIQAEPAMFNCGVAIPKQLGVNAHSILMALGGIVGQEKQSNMLANFTIRKGNDNYQLKKRILLVGSVALVMIVGLVVSLVAKHSAEQELEGLVEYNENPMRQVQLMDYELYAYQASASANKLSSMKMIEESIETYPVLTSEVIQKLEASAEGYAEIEITSFDAENGTMRFTVSANEVEQINQFIAELLKIDLFTKVDYTGYSFSEGENKWDVHVSCIMAESVGR